MEKANSINNSCMFQKNVFLKQPQDYYFSVLKIKEYIDALG